jgi:hypothetical protein
MILLPDLYKYCHTITEGASSALVIDSFDIGTRERITINLKKDSIFAVGQGICVLDTLYSIQNDFFLNLQFASST